MTQTSPAPAAQTLLRCARRALLLLAGAFVWWLLSITGAHADDGAGQAAKDVTASLQGAQADHDSPRSGAPTDGAVAKLRETADDTTRPVTAALRTVPKRATTAVAGATGTAPTPVRTTVTTLTTTLEPTLTATTTALADTVDRTVETATTTLANSLGTNAQAATDIVAVPHTGVQARDHDAGRTTSSRTSARTASTPAVSLRQGTARPAHEQPVRDDVPTSGTPTATSTGSTGSGGTACLGILWLISPLLPRTRRVRDNATVPSGPASGPGCSPD